MYAYVRTYVRILPWTCLSLVFLSLSPLSLLPSLPLFLPPPPPPPSPSLLPPPSSSLSLSLSLSLRISLNQESSEDDINLHGSESSEESDEEFDDTASLASSVADLSSGMYIRTCIYIYTYVCIYIYMCIHTYVHIYMYVCVCIHTFTFYQFVGFWACVARGGKHTYKLRQWYVYT